MSNQINNGGPAFPYAFEHDEPPQSGFSPGMSLRAYFAGQAMSNSELIDIGGTVESAAKELGIPIAQYNYTTHWPKLVAKQCVRFADALIAELNKPEEDNP